jgi:hypothetical protein
MSANTGDSGMGTVDLNAQKEQMLLQQQIEAPKSSEAVFELPCGYLAPDGTLHKEMSLREMTGREEDLLASKKTPPFQKMNELFVRCIQRLGSLTERAQLAVAVPELLVGDRTYLMFAIRRVTLGDEYPFRHRCPSCERESLFTVDLSEMRVQEMADPRKRTYEGVLSDGTPYRFHLLNGRDQSRLEEVTDNERKVTQALMSRIDVLGDRPPGFDGVRALTSRLRNELRTKFDEVDGGVDTEVEIVCPKCDHEFFTELDVGPGFFFPSVMQRNSKKRSST